jgi:hypothetical protein
MLMSVEDAHVFYVSIFGRFEHLRQWGWPRVTQAPTKEPSIDGSTIPRVCAGCPEQWREKK